MPRILILGCGNPLRSDDAVALHVIDALQDLADNPGLTIKAVRQLAPELAEAVSEVDTVIFVDATANDAAGHVNVSPVEETPSTQSRFSHSLTPASLVSLARTLYDKAPKNAFLVTIGASSFDISEDLSELVSRAVSAATLAIRNLISAAKV